MILAPRELQELSFRINRLVQNLTARLGREPSDSEIAHELEIPVSRVNEAYEVDRRRTLISLDQALSNDAGSEQSLIDTLIDGRYQNTQMAKEDGFIAEAIKDLRDGLKEVVQLTFLRISVKRKWPAGWEFRRCRFLVGSGLPLPNYIELSLRIKNQMVPKVAELANLGKHN